jgi:putative ATP-dependent endonuclease of the OLD family
MYLARVEITNFRIFGGTVGEDGVVGTPGVTLDLRPGLNLLVGENDSGKTAVIDAVRVVLGTTSDDWYAFTREDFHDVQGIPQSPIHIACEFKDLSDEEGGALLEWLGLRGTGKDTEPVLRIMLTATLRRDVERRTRWEREIDVRISAGLDAVGLRMENESRSLLRSTYLKPLRDAERELSPGRRSRLSQILMSHPGIARRATPSTRTDLEQAMDEADSKIQKNPEVQSARKDIQERYLSKMLLRRTGLAAKIGLKQTDLRQILERMDLLLVPEDKLASPDGRRDLSVGLGHNNVLFMAAELLLAGLRTTPALPLVLVEEPEAHLHPQLQATVMQLIQELCEHPTEGTDHLQVIATTHSTQLAASVDLERLVIMRVGKAYRLGRDHTKLEPADYAFLRKFLDATKANLFFAHAVLLVEGHAEQLLLPTLARLIGRPLTENGVSIVNVGHRGLFRYSRIFQRRRGDPLDIRVACVMDSDLKSGWAEIADSYSGESKDITAGRASDRQRALRRLYDGKPVKAFPSTQWTLEHDIALTELASFMAAAIKLCGTAGSSDHRRWAEEVDKAQLEIDGWLGRGFGSQRIAWLIHRRLTKKKSKAETADVLAHMLEDAVARGQLNAERLRACLPKYLVDAIDYVCPEESAPSGQLI